MLKIFDEWFAKAYPMEITELGEEELRIWRNQMLNAFLLGVNTITDQWAAAVEEDEEEGQDDA